MGNQNGISLKLFLGWPCPEKDFNNPKSLLEFHLWSLPNLLSVGI